jgi:predicted ABC-type sugar transport system permease subunit
LSLIRLMIKHGLCFSLIGGGIGLLVGFFLAMYYTATTGFDGGNAPAFTIPIGVVFGCFGGLAFGAWKWFKQWRAEQRL